jgi:hypothetical protein
MTNWTKIQLDALEFGYKGFYDYAKGTGANDDRRLYVNIYNIIEEAINDASKVENTLICIALSKEIKKRKKILNKITRNFHDEYMNPNNKRPFPKANQTSIVTAIGDGIIIGMGMHEESPTIEEPTIEEQAPVPPMMIDVYSDFTATELSDIVEILENSNSETRAHEYLEGLGLSKAQLLSLAKECGIPPIRPYSTMKQIRNTIVDWKVGSRLRRDVIRNVDVSFKGVRTYA